MKRLQKTAQLKTPRIRELVRFTEQTAWVTGPGWPQVLSWPLGSGQDQGLCTARSGFHRTRPCFVSAGCLQMLGGRSVVAVMTATW